MNLFYKNTVESHLHKLISERDYYISHVENDAIPENQRDGYELMAKFYDALILAARKYIEESLDEHPGRTNLEQN